MKLGVVEKKLKKKTKKNKGAKDLVFSKFRKKKCKGIEGNYLTMSNFATLFGGF